MITNLNVKLGNRYDSDRTLRNSENLFSTRAHVVEEGF